MNSELNLIEEYFYQFVELQQQKGDDACYINTSTDGQFISVNGDSSIEGLHFLTEDNPGFIASKALMSAISDLVCKGIEPHSYNLCLSLSKKHFNKQWIKVFTDKLLDLNLKYNLKLVGGDITLSKETVISAFIVGLYNKDYKPPLRSRANLEDDLYIVGNKTGYGYHIYKEHNINDFVIYKDKDVMGKYIKLIQKFAKASIDISDGLIGDISKLAKQSNLMAYINIDKVILENSQHLSKLNKIDRINFGEDYSIVFTCSANRSVEIQKYCTKMNLPISKIGHMDKIINNSNIAIKDKGQLITNLMDYNMHGFVHKP